MLTTHQYYNINIMWLTLKNYFFTQLESNNIILLYLIYNNTILNLDKCF